MRRLLAMLTVLAAIVFAVGFYRGWFLVDRDRIYDDTQKALDRVKDTSGKILESGKDQEK